ncbi:MAG: ATP-binding cassette domain-containing protein [Proteobacteria bacterium]|nr:ATP-binding cassette domain-containing protein [Pseudomonadota bacterium]
MSVLEFKDVELTDSGRHLFKGFDLSLEAGERLVVFGASGTGKRALLKLAAGILKPDSGCIAFEARGNPTPVGYVTRDGGLLANMTLLQNVVLPLVYHKILPQKTAELRAKALLLELGVQRAAMARPAAATMPARRLAQFARALLAEPVLYVLESPLDEMDAAGAASVRRVLERIRGDGRACAILSTGFLGPYLDWGDRFLMLHEDRVRFFGGREELLRDPDPTVKVFLS